MLRVSPGQNRTLLVRQGTVYTVMVHSRSLEISFPDPQTLQRLQKMGEFLGTVASFLSSYSIILGLVIVTFLPAQAGVPFMRLSQTFIMLIRMRYTRLDFGAYLGTMMLAALKNLARGSIYDADFHLIHSSKRTGEFSRLSAPITSVEFFYLHISLYLAIWLLKFIMGSKGQNWLSSKLKVPKKYSRILGGVVDKLYIIILQWLLSESILYLTRTWLFFKLDSSLGDQGYSLIDKLATGVLLTLVIQNLCLVVQTALTPRRNQPSELENYISGGIQKDRREWVTPRLLNISSTIRLFIY